MTLAADFTPGSALLGGALLGLSASGMWWLLGRLTGVAGIFGNALRPASAWRLAFLGGLLLTGFLAARLGPALPFTLEAGYGQAAIAGLLVGLGTQWSSGCTSGHGVCGVGRLSPRSLAATLTFVLTGFATVYVLRHVA